MGSLHLKMDIQAQWWLILLGVIFGVMIILAVLYFTKTECQPRGKMVLDSKEMIGEEKTSVRVPGNRVLRTQCGPRMKLAAFSQRYSDCNRKMKSSRKVRQKLNRGYPSLKVKCQNHHQHLKVRI